VASGGAQHGRIPAENPLTGFGAVTAFGRAVGDAMERAVYLLQRLSGLAGRDKSIYVIGEVAQAQAGRIRHLVTAGRNRRYFDCSSDDQRRGDGRSGLCFR
jgi:hypothetical protein